MQGMPWDWSHTSCKHSTMSRKLRLPIHAGRDLICAAAGVAASTKCAVPKDRNTSSQARCAGTAPRAGCCPGDCHTVLDGMSPSVNYFVCSAPASCCEHVVACPLEAIDIDECISAAKWSDEMHAFPVPALQRWLCAVVTVEQLVRLLHAVCSFLTM